VHFRTTINLSSKKTHKDIAYYMKKI